MNFLRFFTLGAFDNVARKRPPVINTAIANTRNALSHADSDSNIDNTPISEIQKRYKRLRLSSFIVLAGCLYSIWMATSQSFAWLDGDSVYGMRAIYSVAVLMLFATYYLKLLKIGFITRMSINPKSRRDYQIEEFFSSIKQNPKTLIMPKLIGHNNNNKRNL